ncbi:MAG: sugar ABC transporter substrate-binding protein [Candidatus Nanopelagicales bacterium]
MKSNKLLTLAGASVLALTLAACGSSGGSSTSSSAAPAPTEASSSAPASSSAAPAPANEVVKKVAFFGFWKTNSFTQAVLKGVQDGAAEIGAEVLDLSPAEYDAAAQIKAVQDQTIKGDAQVYVMLASDSVGMATAAKEAIDKGITVVAAFTPLGSDFTTLEPQVPGLAVVGETPVSNGSILAELAAEACADLNPCNVAYLEGFKALPLDNARTEAFVTTLATADPNAKLVAQVEGGYSPDAGKKAAQDALQANPDINVMVGSSQAILGAETVVDPAKVKLIGNGASCEAFDAVKAGKWYALYNLDTVAMGYESVILGSEIANGGTPALVINSQDLRNPKGTADVIADYECAYSDLG